MTWEERRSSFIKLRIKVQTKWQILYQVILEITSHSGKVKVIQLRPLIDLRIRKTAQMAKFHWNNRYQSRTNRKAWASLRA